MKSQIIIEYLPAAQADLEEIFNYIAKENPDAALQSLEKFDTSISRLEQSPLLGMIPKLERLARQGYRILSVRDYLTFYLLVDGIVEIHKIIHGWKKTINIAPVQNVSKEGRVIHKDMMEHLRNKIISN